MDYLKSLFEHFATVLGSPDEDQHQAETAAFNALHAELDDAKQRKLLLRLRDAEDAQREAAAYNGFVVGFRLATGIAAELRALPAYSYEDDAIERARKSLE